MKSLKTKPETRSNSLVNTETTTKPAKKSSFCQPWLKRLGVVILVTIILILLGNILYFTITKMRTAKSSPPNSEPLDTGQSEPARIVSPPPTGAATNLQPASQTTAPPRQVVDWQCPASPRQQQTVVISNFTAVCDGGGWVVIQRRTTEDDFFQNWETYASGFGNKSTGGDHWLGLRNVHVICNKLQPCKLRIDLVFPGRPWCQKKPNDVWCHPGPVVQRSDSKYFAEYSQFFIGSEADHFRLHLGAYHGTAGDSLTGHYSVNGSPFSTLDTFFNSGHLQMCSRDRCAGWWFGNGSHCGGVNLNGRWGSSGDSAVRWVTLSGAQSVQAVLMKIKSERA